MLTRTLRTVVRESLWEVAAVAPYYLRSRSRVVSLLVPALRDRPEETVRRVGCPLVVLRGDGDLLSPAAWAAQLAAPRPVTTMPGAHNFPYTHPEESSSVLRRFFARAGLDA